MNPIAATVNRLLASALAGAALLTFGTGLLRAQIMLRFPGESPGAPYYANVERPFMWHTEQWAAIVFVRAPVCVPANFNLLDLLDPPAPPDHPGAFACPLTVSGLELWDNPGVDAVPRQTLITGNAVPVWFVPWPILQAAMADDVLTKSELESLAPLKGVASVYHEVIHLTAPPGTTGGAKMPHMTITASGFLPDGRSFQYEFTSKELGEVQHVRIVIH